MLALALGIGCGPAVADSSDSGSSGRDPSTSTSTSTTSNGTVATAATSLGSTSQLSESTTSGRENSGSTSSGTGFIPTGGGCDDAAAATLPAVPEGCTSIPLADADGSALPDSPSGLVRCDEPSNPDVDLDVHSIFQTGKVLCPFSTGNCACDSDCGRGQQCLCDYANGGGWPDQDGNRCVPSDCRSDADCDGERCRAEVLFCGTYGYPVEFHCTSPEDDCDTHTTCIEQGLQYCEYDGTVELFTCSPGAICE